jgi:hypothetical protein
MSKQSRAKSKRHNHKKKVGTGAAAPTRVVRLRAMNDGNRYYAVQGMLDDLHSELWKKRNTWGMEIINLLYCEMWSEMEHIIAVQRKSESKERVLKLIVDIKVSQNIGRKE